MFINKENLLDIINSNECLRSHCFVDEHGEISSHTMLKIFDENFNRTIGIFHDGNIVLPLNLIKSFKITSDRLKTTKNFPKLVANMLIEKCHLLEHIDLSHTHVTPFFNENSNILSNIINIIQNNKLQTITNIIGNEESKIKLQISFNKELEYVQTKNILQNFIISDCYKIKSFNNFDFEICPNSCLFGENLNIENFDGIEKINNNVIYMVADKIKDFKGVENATTKELQVNSISTPKNILCFMLLTIPLIKFDNAMFSTPRIILSDKIRNCDKFVKILSKIPNHSNRSEHIMDALVSMLDVADFEESLLLNC